MAYHFITASSADSIFFRLKPVRYVAQRPIVSMSEILQMLSTKESPRNGVRSMLAAQSLLERFFLQKSLEWNYEEEERIVIDQNTENSFLPEELFAVVVGPYFSDENLGRLRAILLERSRPVRIFRSHISKTDYAVEVDWSTPL